MTDRQKTTEAVFVAILKQDSVLLQLRKNTGWLDGSYDLLSGHIEPGEKFLTAGVREVAEEGGLTVKQEDLELFHVSQHEGGNKGPYTYFMFPAGKWQGKLATNDPDKVEELKFVPLNNLPDNTAPYVKRALRDIAANTVTFAYFNSDGTENT